jgi:hypothetical protein
MECSLHDYTEDTNPKLLLTEPILHPTNKTSVIGHVGFDKGRDVSIATFPRKKSEHWFQGKSTSGLTGYGISEDVLDRLNNDGQTIERVIVIETDNGRVIEYERSEFEDAIIVAYAPSLNESLIGESLDRVDDEVYNDRQRVIPVDRARRVFDREEVSIYEK